MVVKLTTGSCAQCMKQTRESVVYNLQGVMSGPKLHVLRQPKYPMSC
jgi:hypothetical protein